MKIAFLTTGYPPLWSGGTEIASLRIVERLTKNHKGIVVTRKEGEKMSKYIKRATQFLKKTEVDIIHCQSIAPALAARKAHKPYIVYCRGSDIYSPKGWGWKAINKVILRKAEKVIVLTKHMQRKVKKDYNVDSVVIPNGVNASFFYKDSSASAEPTIIYSGTLKKIKGIEYLIKAMKYLPHWNLWIVGDGPERKNLEKLCVKEKIIKFTFFGKVNRKKLRQLLSVSDFFVLPSLSEGFPNVLLEAMASGLPIVSTKVKGIPEIIENKKNGLLVSPKNSLEIASALKNLNANKKNMEIASKNNLAKAKRYSWENTVSQLEEVYENIIHSRQIQTKGRR